MPEWIYEFLYRGVSAGETGGAWHLITMNQIGQQRVMNMTQAEAAGWGLPQIIDTINVATMQEVEALRVENAALKAENEALASQINSSPAEQGVDDAEQNRETEADNGRSRSQS